MFDKTGPAPLASGFLYTVIAVVSSISNSAFRTTSFTFVVSLFSGLYLSMIVRVLFSSSVALLNLVFGNTASDSTLVSILTLLALILNLSNPLKRIIFLLLSVGTGSSFSVKLV